LQEGADTSADALFVAAAVQTEASLSSSWASVNGTGMWNVTGPTNMMQASECDEHCNWNDKEVFYGTAQVWLCKRCTPFQIDRLEQRWCDSCVLLAESMYVACQHFRVPCTDEV
jgi:hypothetical protein